MWDIVEIDSKEGKLTKTGSYSSAEECKQKISRGPDKQTYYLWMGAWPTDSTKAMELFESVVKANDNAPLRLTVGMNFAATRVEGISGCSGDCFCVVANGGRNCEAKYCNENGYCWWVSCGSYC